MISLILTCEKTNSLCVLCVFAINKIFLAISAQDIFAKELIIVGRDFHIPPKTAGIGVPALQFLFRSFGLGFHLPFILHRIVACKRILHISEYRNLKVQSSPVCVCSRTGRRSDATSFVAAKRSFAYLVVKLAAPGGNLKMALGVLDAGADAVFVGSYGWSRRAKEFELTDEEIRELADEVTQRDKELRLGVNTFPSSKEIDLLINRVEKYVKWGVTDFILTDPGIIYKIKSIFPELQIHASVGANIINSEDVKFYTSIGASICVLPCKLLINEVKEIIDSTDAAIEILVHANTDFTYLGKCTMSSYFKYGSWIDNVGKNHFPGSPNRGGLCYRVCKTEWEARTEIQSAKCKMQNAKEEDGNFLRDSIPVQNESFHCSTTLDNDAYFMLTELANFAKCGVKWFKLQGRVFSPDLMFEITKTYRNIVDEINAFGDFSIQKYSDILEKLGQKRDSQRTQRTSQLLKEIAN